MEILGIGMPELIAILIGMLVIAGPQRMFRWAYTLGRYAGKLQGWWREAASALQQEMDASGVNVTIPKDIPTRQTLQRDKRRAFNNLQSPAQEPLRALKSEMNAALKLEASDQGVTRSPNARESAVETQQHLSNLQDIPA